eukprot:1184208-Pyramimonas_sp.AAC.1
MTLPHAARSTSLNTFSTDTMLPLIVIIDAGSSAGLICLSPAALPFLSRAFSNRSSCASSSGRSACALPSGR